MNQIIIYQSEDKTTHLEIHLKQETIWLTQKQIAAVFGTEVPAINKHLKKIFKDRELSMEATVSKMEIVQEEGRRKVKREIEHYNLDAILSVGYRVSSCRATQFRIWATQRLKDHLVQGYTINQKRLEQLQQTVELIRKTAANETTEAKGLLDMITHYNQRYASQHQ